MSIVAAYAVPHPPLIVPSVGRGEERKIEPTIDAYREVARRVAAHEPDTIIVSSPHAPAYYDAFAICGESKLAGDMSQFRSRDEMLCAIDAELAFAVERAAADAGLPVYSRAWRHAPMDHATFVPLHFVNQFYTGYRLVVVGLSGLSAHEHRVLGQVIAAEVERLGRRAVYIASGDLSHKLKADGPYGYVPEGPVFDELITQAFAENRLDDIFKFDPDLTEAAAECGLRSFQIMAGALDGLAHTGELLSYEGPFGVGYGVAAFELADNAQACKSGSEGAGCLAGAAQDAEAGGQEDAAGEPIGQAAEAPGRVRDDEGGSLAHPPCEDAGAAEGRAHDATSAHSSPDPYVALARESFTAYTLRREHIAVPDWVPPEILDVQAGAFVSLHMDGDLRGCIGTLGPVRDSLAEEIICNAIAACSEDPRFPPVTPEELERIECSVDVLGEPEPIDGLDQLDPKRYGVIVTRMWQRGVLLPDLEGVDTVQMQVAIAKQKAGIPQDARCKLQRFEVVRHHEYR